LKSLDVPGLFFLPTDYIESNKIPWWDKIAYMMRSADRDAIHLQYPSDIQIDMTNRESAIREALEIYTSPQVVNRSMFIEEIAESCGVKAPSAVDPPLFLDWKQAIEMVRGGMSIGSHTVSHEILSKQSPNDQYKELEKSKRILSERLEVDIHSFAYPVGTRSTFSMESLRAAEMAGYKVAFSFYGGINRTKNFNRFNILRVPVDNETTIPMFRFRIAAAGTTGWQI
jgi:peptidoglycan/xylan/chitin deacetylase (PgdA/CDA1 family)